MLGILKKTFLNNIIGQERFRFLKGIDKTKETK